jgi:parallel beta-helix repeat protein
MKRLTLNTVVSRPERRLLGIVVLCAALAVTAFLIPASSQAKPSQVSCGATITSDTTLNLDLTNCPNEGIVIGADNITLDLNGHTVGGDGTPVPSCPDGAFCDIGIDNTAGHTGVTIKGGSVTGFDFGIFVLGASDNRIQRISLTNNASLGMLVGDSHQTRIDHNSAVGDGTSAIVMFNSHDNRIDHNSVTGEHGYAIPVFDSNHNRLEKNMLDGNDHGILLDTSNDNAVKDNRISHSGGSSIDIGHARNNRVEGNLLSDDGDGVILFEAQGNQISDNSVSGTGFFGFADTGGFGVILDGAAHNLVQRNVVTGGRGPAIFITSLDSPQPSDSNTISDNVANSKLADGILVNNNATETLLEHNTANASGHDGIHADAPGTTVTLNTTNDNHGLGIDAVPGVIDGGGNRATGNGNPLQCTNVSCS